MIKKLCTFGGCKEIVEHNGDGSSPRCTQHVSKYKTVKYVHHHHNNKNIYKTTKWRKLRNAKIMLTPLCEHCLLKNRSTLAQMVDHIVEILDGGEIWQMSNLQSLCNACHNTKTSKEHIKRNNKSKYPKLSDF